MELAKCRECQREAFGLPKEPEKEGTLLSRKPGYLCERHEDALFQQLVAMIKSNSIG